MEEAKAPTIASNAVPISVGDGKGTVCVPMTFAAVQSSVTLAVSPISVVMDAKLVAMFAVFVPVVVVRVAMLAAIASASASVVRGEEVVSLPPENPASPKIVVQPVAGTGASCGSLSHPREVRNSSIRKTVDW